MVRYDNDLEPVRILLCSGFVGFSTTAYRSTAPLRSAQWSRQSISHDIDDVSMLWRVGLLQHPSMADQQQARTMNM